MLEIDAHEQMVVAFDPNSGKRIAPEKRPSNDLKKEPGLHEKKVKPKKIR